MIETFQPLIKTSSNYIIYISSIIKDLLAMSDVSGDEELKSHKRNLESSINEKDDLQNKRQKTEESGDHEDQLNDIFNDPVPGFGGNGENESRDNGETGENELGPEDFDKLLAMKEGDPLDIDFDNLPASLLEHEVSSSKASESQVGTPGGLNLPNASGTTNTGSISASPNLTPRPTPVSNTDSRSGTPMSYPPPRQNQDTPGIKVEPGASRPVNKNDFVRKPYPQVPNVNRINQLTVQPQGIQGLNTSSIDRPAGNNTREQLHTNDPSKLNDALAAAGVDIQQEEELLMQQHLNRSSRFTSMQQPQRQTLRFSLTSLFNPYHVAAFMQKVSRENGVMQNFYQDTELLELMSASCENWLSNILTKTIVLSRHRRREIVALANARKDKKATGSGTGSNSAPRSELSRELRNIAVKQKEMEERRVTKRMALGLENNGSDPDGDAANGAKAGAEETLHRAANATAAMMTMNPGRKKYSWMTANAGSGGSEDGKAASEKDGKGKQSSIIAARGDNGLRFREIRSGNSVIMKDLLGALENERMGTEKAIVKGYAKLKD